MTVLTKEACDHVSPREPQYSKIYSGGLVVSPHPSPTVVLQINFLICKTMQYILHLSKGDTILYWFSERHHERNFILRLAHFWKSEAQIQTYRNKKKKSGIAF